MTALDDSTEALADHLHMASVAAAQLADARDQDAVLTVAEADRRAALLSALRDGLADLEVPCVLARNQRLVLRYNQADCGPSGLTDPVLHIFPAGGGARSATTDGSTYRLDSGEEFPASDPAAAATLISGGIA